MLKHTHRERPSIPDPDYDDPKELYAFYGLSAYSAQLLEQGIINLLVGLKILDIQTPTHGDVINLFDGSNTKTMGNLLNTVRRITPFSDDLDEKIKEALKKRNYLIHHFFVEHDQDLLTDDGRRKMINELIDIIALLKEVDQQVDDLWLGIWSKYGWTEDRIEKELLSIKQNLEKNNI